MAVVYDTIRWKVVKMAHNLKDDLEVAKMLLDCYDAIISGCFQWENNVQKKRIPYCTSEKGWKLLEEVRYMMEWKARQDFESRNKVLTIWKDDDEDDQTDDQNSDHGNEDAGGKVEDAWHSTVDDDIDVDEEVEDKEWLPKAKDNKPNEHGMPKNATSTPVKPILLLDTEKQESSERKTSGSKPKTKYAPKGYKKLGRPTKAIEILHTPEQTKFLECKRCIDRFTNIEDFVKHYQSHTEAIIIGTKAHQVSELKVEDIPLIATIFIPCKDCNELTDNLELHQMNKHFRRACEICGKLFTSFGGWSRHMKTHKAKESGVMPHICDKCGKGFPLVGTLTIHRKLHLSARPHICEVCGKGFKLSSRLMRHKSVHTAKVLSCEYCGKTFNYKFNLKTHLRTHTGERPFVCSICHKSYSHNSSLKAHAKSEHGIDMEFGCQRLTEFDGADSAKQTAESTTQSTVSANRHLAGYFPITSKANVTVNNMNTPYTSSYTSDSVLIQF